MLRKTLQGGVFAPRTFGNVAILILLQFLLKFAQGQGPGQNNVITFSVYENRPPGTEVGIIPTHPSSRYEFGDDNGKKNFILDSSTGRLTTKLRFDREALKLPENKFNILIYNHTSNATFAIEVSIIILDENDVTPYFPSDRQNVTFRENSALASHQYIPTAADDDIGFNGEVDRYEIVSGDGPFTLVYDPSLYGDVLIIQPTGNLDRETNSSYVLKIIASDRGSPPRTGSTTVFITIQDENDNPPIFDPSSYHASVNETDSIGTLVIQVIASDRDIGKNQEITYKFVDENQETGQFRIEENTGKIYTKSEPLVCPNKGQCLLTIEARDHGMPFYTGRAFVYITVVDTNNHDPVIAFGYVPSSNTEFSSINEDAKNGDIVAGVILSDADDGDFGETTARIVSGNELRHFKFVPFVPSIFKIVVNGDSVLDRERHHMYNLTIEAIDNGNPPRTTVSSLIIYVNDINDHAPAFINNKVKLQISETSEIGSFIANMYATDFDTGTNAKLTYKILSGNNPEWFKINPQTGLITTATRLHYEIQNYFKMNISVHDGALNPLYDYAELEISIWDENDMPPEFSSDVYNVSLTENVQSGAPVVSASAKDNDSGLNGSITYSFHSHVQLMYPNTFYLDTKTGSVTTRKALDREAVNHYTLLIIAKDQGPVPMSSTATVYLEVEDVNDNAPTFYPKNYYVKVLEGQSEDIEIARVTATDPDDGENGRIIYSITGTDYERFTLDSATGILKARRRLSKSDGSSFQLTIMARDPFGENSDTALIKITVLSATDRTPKFSQNSYRFEINEDSSKVEVKNIGGNVGFVRATVESSSSPITYTLVEGDPSNIFSLDSSSGWIKRAKAVDREEYALFLLKIVASAGDLFTQTDVTIIVNDSNDNAPQFEYPFVEIDLLESWPVGHHITVAKATDPDGPGPNSRIVYYLQRDENSMFGIVASTGLVYLNKPLHQLGSESVTLTVIAMDSGSPENTASQELRLKLKDVNNHSPKFPYSTFEMSLIESHPVNSKFFSVEAVDDDDGKNGELIFNITRGNEDGKFGIFPDGNLFIAKQLDRETKDLYKLSVRAMDKGVPPRSSECNITIHITDYNDNKPIFLNATYSFYVTENKPVTTFVGHVRASDDDMGRNAELSYFFRDDQTNFKIDSQTGEILTLKSFDREELADQDYSHTFDVIVKDNGLTRLEDTATVRIIIQDENDNPPKFRKPIYKVTVFENAPPFTNITVVKADDPDSGINSVVTYDIINGNEEDNFFIAATTGQIMLNQKLDREYVDSYKLTISAIDSGTEVRHSATTIVKITVGDINDNFPLFAQSHLDISQREDLQPGSMVAYFPATDTDLGINGEITYTMSGVDDDQTFGIDKHTGKIYLLKKLDYEKKRTYRLNVTATDNGVPPLPYYIRFSISIEDVNDNAPVFEDDNLSFHVKEHSSGSVGIVTATDADSNQNGEIEYQITFQDPPADYFQILKNGQIYIKKEVDRETVEVVTLTVMAVDHANASSRLSSETQVKIYIDDINDNEPVITSFNAIAVPKNTPRNEFLTTITASDKDANKDSNGRIILQLSHTYFGLENTGRLYLKQNLPSTPLKYTLTVKANDYGSPQKFSQMDMTVFVTDNTGGPVFQDSSYAGQVKENSAVGKSILRVRAISQQNSAVEYFVTNITNVLTGQQVGRYFKVDKSSGVLSTAEVLDREAIGDDFVVQIYAIDVDGSQPRTSHITARVQVLDENDTPPYFSSNYYSVTVDEDVHTDFPVAKVTMNDDDSTGGLQLTLDSGSEVNLKITQEGNIVTTGPLDYERQRQYTLRVTATDGNQSSFCMVRINVLDKNDNAPQFTQAFYTFDINEDTLIGTTVGAVRAHDDDEGVNAEVEYHMTSDWANQTFALDSEKGTFTLLSVLNFEESQLYTLIVRATDKGSPTQTSTVTVYFNVKDVNDNTPLFEHGTYDAAIKEDVVMGTSVVQVVAFDVDSGVNGKVQYSIADGDLYSQFVIDPVSGVIVTAAILDRETTASYRLNVTATDMAEDPDQRLSASAEVLVTILDVNDYQPIFLSPSMIRVMENTPQGTEVHRVLVQDLDEGVNKEVEFAATSRTSGMPFTLGKSDGVLRVNADLDRESIQNYTLIITVRDKGSPVLSAIQTLMIIIEDENDHTPVFYPEYYHVNEAEDVTIGKTLLQVTATDVDAGLNGIVRYFIIAGDDNHDFSLDQSSGVLRVQKSLDYERVTEYKIIVQAEDSGDNTRSSTATVSIEISDVNDNAPFFFDSPFVGWIRENMDELPVHVLNVLAHDDDSFSEISYSIREGSRDVFSLDSNTGEITGLRMLDREEKSEYILTVVAIDSATGRGLTGTGTVSIYVEDVNDNAPVFEHTGNYVAHIAENADVNSEVIVVKAADKDEGANAQIIYSLRDNIDNKFNIFPDTGRISTMVELDREEQSQYTLEVIAHDSSMVPLSATTTVRVFVDDVNDLSPEFDKQNYSRVMLPSTPGTFVIGVTATDRDIGNNGMVEYSLPLQSNSGYFQIDSQTGVITAKQSLLPDSTYSFQVKATDKGTNPLSTLVTVTVTIASASGITLPQFDPLPSELKVAENQMLGRNVTQVHASSSRPGLITYSIAGGNVGQAFSIGTTTGVVTIGGVVDYEAAAVYHLWVEARQENPTPVSQYAKLVITVEDMNDNRPRFEQTVYSVSVKENSPIGTSVAKVTAVDLDSGNFGKVSYTLQGSDASKFIIDNENGLISTFTSSLDREKVDKYNLIVVASDAGNPKQTSSASVRIEILDENDNAPVFARQFREKIPENMEVGSFVVRVTSSDKDIGDNAIATYSLADDANGLFMIDGVSGNITLNKPLDAEVQSSYTLRVSALDGAHDIQVNVEIDVSDVNDNNPVITEPFAFSFPEMSPIGSFVGQLKATDRDISAPNNQVYFSLKLASNYFHLDSDDGTVTSLEELTFDPSMDPDLPPNRHELVVIAKDLGTPVRSSERTIYVNVVDYNDHAPEFEQTSYKVAVPDVTPNRTSVLTVVARDDLDFDDNAVVEYFAAGGNGTKFFHVDRFLGIISVSSSLNGQRNRDFVVIVRAEDKGVPPQSATATVQLVITDQNRYAPQFIHPASKQISVHEDKAVGSLIETFVASDNDQGMNAEIDYEITGGNEEGLFALHKTKGTLVVSKELDYEMSHDYTLNITAKDRGLYSKSSTISYLVRLIDVNDNDPVFATTADIIFVEENTPRGTSVYHAVATDADSGENAKIRYNIVEDTHALMKFNIDESTGIVTTKGDLDYETKMSYSLTIMALNPDSAHKSTMSLTVYIEGVNEYVPRFVQDTYYFSISESAAEKTDVGSVSATDNDAGEDGIVNYFLIGDSNSKGFKIKPVSGEIYVSGQPDYESSPRITLQVLAKNWGSVKGNDTDTCTVHISVQDANDPPVFTPDVYNPHIKENSGADTSVVTVFAEDYDFEIEDKQFSYTILAGNSEGMFKIDPQSGYISTTGKGVLDRELVPVFNITVGAIDTGSPRETGSATVHIHLDDVNDNGPEFVNFTAKVTEGQSVATLVMTLTQVTTDPDDHMNRDPYTYFYVPGSHVEYDYFQINQNGDVTTKKILDRESIPEFNVPVVVKDGGVPTMTSTLSFKVSVIDINDTPPTERFLTLFLSLYAGSFPSSTIADIRPLDKDIAGIHTCSLSSSSSPFAVTSSSCDLYLTQYPMQKSYTLKVTGNDGAHSPVSYDVAVRITAFNNNTIDHSTIIQLADIKADDFMKNSYTNFVTSVSNLFETQDEVYVYGITEQQSGDLLLFLAVKQNSKEQYYRADELRQKLSAAQNIIQSNAGIYIVDVAYTTCQSFYCKNNGKCGSQVSVSSSNLIADSPYQVFSNPELSLSWYCVCPPQFTGPDCSQPASQCGNTYCQNGGQCLNTGSGSSCQCPDTWTGTSCESDINECSNNVCQNGATCENLQGGFVCHCRDGFYGPFCQDGQDYCSSSPCVRGTCQNVENGYRCICPYGYWGDNCDFSSRGFSVGSYAEFSRVIGNVNELEVVFATEKEDALLLYNPSSDRDSGHFVALEILNGRVRFSVAKGTGEASRISVEKVVNTGEWFRVKVNQTEKTARVWVSSCPADGSPCSECLTGPSCFRQGTIQGNSQLDIGSQPLSIGGIRSIDTILSKPGQVSSHDFVGCMRSFVVNGNDRLLQVQQSESEGITDTCPRTSSADPCRVNVCQNGGTCVSAWDGAMCLCTSKFFGQHCDKELKPFGFGADTRVAITPREDARRDALVATNSRKKRAVLPTTESTVMVRFRTTEPHGILLFTSVVGGSKYSVLTVVDRKLMFTISQYGASNSATIDTPTVADGNWHNASVTINGSGIYLSLDGEHHQKSSAGAFLFNSLDIKELSLGGAKSSITIGNQSLKDFTGCISVFELDGKSLPMNGTTDFYNVVPQSGVENGCTSLCAGFPCSQGTCVVDYETPVCSAVDGSVDDEGALSIGIIVVIAFFGILIIVIIVVFIVFRHRGKQLCVKKKVPQQNGNTLSKSANSSGHSHQDSGYSENNIDELIIRNHIAQELKGNMFSHTNGRLVEPDIIGSERTARTHLPLEMEDGTVIIDNASDVTHLRDLNGEAPELYDLENASSIAPSDIDVIEHYRYFHHNGRKQKRKKAHSDHSQNSQHSSSKHYPPSSHSKHSHQMRDSPNLVTSVPYLNDLATNSPQSGRNSQSPINQLSRQSPNVRQSPLTHMNMHNHNMPITDLNTGSRTTSERSLASHRSRNSNSTPNKPKRQMLPNGHPANGRKINNNYENKQFLTLEEVDRLNSRPRESPASLMEAFSTSSENNTRKIKKPFEQYQDTSVLLEPPESSSDDSTNDSFTCSEFEYENDKQRNDFDPNSRIFSNLTEEDNEMEEGAYHNKIFKSDGLDSGGNSFSSTVGSSDESQSKAKHLTAGGTFNWDDLLNWGPKFEKLVGVFTDIALLPDADNVDFSEVEGRVTDREEYV